MFGDLNLSDIDAMGKDIMIAQNAMNSMTNQYHADDATNVSLPGLCFSHAGDSNLSNINAMGKCIGVMTLSANVSHMQPTSYYDCVITKTLIFHMLGIQMSEISMYQCC